MFKINQISSILSKDRALLTLLLIGGLYSLSIALSNTFVNVYIWKQSGEYKDIGLYNLASAILQLISFIIAGRVAKHVDRVFVLRIGVVILTLFFLTVLILGERSNEYIILLGALNGLGFGFYWLAFNVLTFEVTEPNTRDFFNGFLGVLGSFAGMVGPISAGWMITSMENFRGYHVIFGISLTLFAIAVVMSLFLKRRNATGTFELKSALKERKQNKDWRNILYSNFFHGFRGGTFFFLISLWVYVSTKSELSLGTFGLVQSGVGLVAYFLAGKFVKPTGRVKSVFVSGLIMYLAIFIIAFKITYINLLFYGVIIALVFPFLFVPYMSMTYDVIGKATGATERRIEYIVAREIYLNSGRIVSITIFIFAVTLFSPEKSIPYLLFILGPGFFFIYFFIRKMNNVTREEENDSKGGEKINGQTK